MDNIDKTAYYKPDIPDMSPGGSAARITLFDGVCAARQIDLNSYGKAVITFGRDPSNDICIKSGYVSRRHGQFRYFNGRWHIEDLGSKNGLLFNGNIIPGKMLCDNDTIRIDDGVESTAIGVLFVFSGLSDSIVWKNITVGNERSFTVGRDPGCNIHLGHVGVSRLHAVIERQSNGYFIYDNHSTNGVWVNGRRISGRVQLHEKDVITITNSKIIFSTAQISYCTFNRGIRVEASHICKKVDHNKKTICDDVSLKIDPCELVAIIGGSGAGKSTLMNCISGYNPPTSGTVTVNGNELYSNLEAIKDIIGYVPQQDIVFDNLSVYDMLKYTARLRLPKDTDASELDSIILKVIDTVELTERKDTLIKKLSGGQRKRASIAVELISDPALFFLDEPASGLDPGTERNLMRTLKNMSASGKTIIFVTHSTLNLRVCDKIIFMGAGGKLCFMGSYDEALRFFEVDDLVDVYNMITENSEYWQKKFISVRKDRISGTPVTGCAGRKKSKQGTLKQISVLSKRHLHVIFNDKMRLLLLLLQAPLLGFLISLVANEDAFIKMEMTRSLFFALSCAAIWVGIMNSIQEICKERVILRREYMTGISLDAYIASKILVMGLICLVQSVLLASVFVACVGCPEYGIISSGFFEILLTTFLTAFSASAMGIFISSLFKNADRAMTVAPILLIPQLLFSGIVFKMEGISEILSYFITCRFSMEAYGTTANLNSLENVMTPLNINYGTPLLSPDPHYEFATSNYIGAIFMLVLFTAAFSALAALAVRGVKKDK